MIDIYSPLSMGIHSIPSRGKESRLSDQRGSVVDRLLEEYAQSRFEETDHLRRTVLSQLFHVFHSFDPRPSMSADSRKVAFHGLSSFDFALSGEHSGMIGPSESRGILERQRFQIRRILALDRGVYSVVLEADDTLFDRLVAIKVLKMDSFEQIENFRREIRLLMRSSHPNILSCYDGGVLHIPGFDRALPFAVLELCVGDFRTISEEAGDLSEHDVLSLLEGAMVESARGLQAFHKKNPDVVFHRDVKPANILLGLDGQAKLADLGLAVTDENYTLMIERMERGISAGTLDFVAPEMLFADNILDQLPPFSKQLNGQRELFQICDWYSWAATWYTNITGESVFPDNDERILVRSVAKYAFKKDSGFNRATVNRWERNLEASLVGPGVLNCLLRLLHRYPERRLESDEDVSRTLEQVCKLDRAAFEARSRRAHSKLTKRRAGLCAEWSKERKARGFQ